MYACFCVHLFLINFTFQRIIKDLATGNHVDIEVDFAKKRIRFNGISTQKSECREKVRRLLSDTIDEHGNLTCQKQLLQVSMPMVLYCVRPEEILS